MVTSPEVFHAGTPTSLAVTLLADFPARVTAELKYGNNIVVQTEGVHEGEARVDLHFTVLNVTSAQVLFFFSKG